MKLLIINGVNLKSLGIREVDVYGKKSYKELVSQIKSCAKRVGVKVKVFQSDCEGRICGEIQKAYGKYDGIIINAGAYTHTSIAILDSLKAVGIKTVEVHLTDIYSREDFRKHSYISLYAEKVIVGKGFEGYCDAIEYFAKTR